jgi:hypothetical protein
MNKSKIVSLFHIFCVAPLLILLSSKKMPNYVYYLVGIMALGVMGYHGQKALQKGLYSGFINILHVGLFAPLLLILSVYGFNVYWGVKFSLLALGYSVLGIHGSRLLI